MARAFRFGSVVRAVPALASARPAVFLTCLGGPVTRPKRVRVLVAGGVASCWPDGVGRVPG